MLQSMGKDVSMLQRNPSQGSINRRGDGTPSSLHGDSRVNAPHQVGSLNYVMRKNEQTKQIEENIMMLKRIHFAKPTIKYDEYQKHA